MRAPLHILTGCTAVGKTEVSLRWAERFDAEIVSCDSMLFYRGMDIGTAKPAPAERARVRHHLIDILSPLERMDVKRYCGLAQEVVREIEGRGRQVLVVGGSGFYLRSFFAAVADDVPVDAVLRGSLERDLVEQGLGMLVRRLQDLNPHGLGRLDVKNPRRVIRALERCLISGRTLEDLATAFRAAAPPFGDREVRMTEISREPDELCERIHARAEAMVAAGLVAEVKWLRAEGFEANPAVASAVGYRDVLAWLDERGTREDLVAAIARSTLRLARKQRTWFRSQMPPHRVVTPGAGNGIDPSQLFV